MMRKRKEVNYEDYASSEDEDDGKMLALLTNKNKKIAAVSDNNNNKKKKKSTSEKNIKQGKENNDGFAEAENVDDEDVNDSSEEAVPVAATAGGGVMSIIDVLSKAAIQLSSSLFKTSHENEANAPFVSLTTVFKNSSEGSIPTESSFLKEIDMKHVWLSIHEVREDELKDTAKKLESEIIWYEELGGNVQSGNGLRVSTGLARHRLMKFFWDMKNLANFFVQLLLAASIVGIVVSSWVSQYHPEGNGYMSDHPDKFSYGQLLRSVLTTGSSNANKSNGDQDIDDGDCENSNSDRKYIRISECGGLMRWIEIWLDNGTLISMDHHGSGADGHYTKTGSTKIVWDDDSNRSYLKHAIFNAQGTTSYFIETRPKNGHNKEQLLNRIHSFRPIVEKPVGIQQNPSYPKADGICLLCNDIKGKKINAKERSEIATFVHWGTFSIQSKEGFVEEFTDHGFTLDSTPQNIVLEENEVWCEVCEKKLNLGNKRNKWRQYANQHTGVFQRKTKTCNQGREHKMYAAAGNRFSYYHNKLVAFCEKHPHFSQDPTANCRVNCVCGGSFNYIDSSGKRLTIISPKHARARLKTHSTCLVSCQG